MDQQITMLSQIDPMMDDVKIMVRVISIWKSHPLGKPNEVWGLELIVQDQQVVTNFFNHLICFYFLYNVTAYNVY